MESYNPNNPAHQDSLVGVSQWQEENNYADSDAAIKLALYEEEIEKREGYVEVESEVRIKWEELSHQKFEAMLKENRRQEFLKKTSGKL